MGDLLLTSLVCISLSDLTGRLQLCGVAGTESHQSRWESVRASRAWHHPPPLLVPLSKEESLEWEVTTWSWCCTRLQLSRATPQPRLLPANTAASLRLSLQHHQCHHHCHHYHHHLIIIKLSTYWNSDMICTSLTVPIHHNHNSMMHQTSVRNLLGSSIELHSQ